jgi:hypothetical protein
MGLSQEPESPAALYRRRAKELRQMAAGAKSPGTHNELVRLATQYEKLAEDAHGRQDRWSS